jgi:hypothetical protein
MTTVALNLRVRRLSGGAEGMASTAMDESFLVTVDLITRLPGG